MSANKPHKAHRTRKLEKADDPFFDPALAASCTECTGILPAEIETEDQGESVAALQGIHRIRPADPSP